MDIRIGHGYDLHRLVAGRPLILGGVAIEYARGLLGHSDADVLTHAVIDSLLGAAAMGDIGRHFPDDDARNKDADSLMMLGCVVELLYSKGGFRPSNIDATVIAQAPKLAPYIGDMRQNLARVCGIEVSRVSVKATTEEGLGPTGAGEAMAAHCVCLIEKA